MANVSTKFNKKLRMPRIFGEESLDDDVVGVNNDSEDAMEDGGDFDPDVKGSRGDDHGSIDIADLEPSKIVGGQPLPRPMQEHFVQLMFQGSISRHEAYRIAFGSKGKDKTLGNKATDLLRKQHVIDRLSFLSGKLKSLPNPTERKDAISFCAGVMRSQNKPTILRLQALDRLAKMLHWFDAPPASTVDKRPDPAWFAEYVRKAKLAHGHRADDIKIGAAGPTLEE